MKKEHIKNIALAVLVVMNIVLSSKILSDKKLWPSGYNFFNADNFPIISFFVKNSSDEENDPEKAVHLTMPEKIIFNTGDQTTRFSVNSNNKEYDAVIKYCEEILVSALSCDENKIAEIDSQEWFSSLMTKSVYLSYYTEYESQLFANFLGLRETVVSQKAETFSNVVIGLSDNVAVYFEDAKTKKYYRIRTGKRFSEFKDAVEEIINSLDVNDSEGNAINYSFDLNFDKSFGTQKTIISSMVPIYSNEQIVPVVSVKRPLGENLSNLDNAVLDEIVRIFNVNANIARRYTEADGTAVFVENNATLKIHNDGMIEYKARDNGIPLASSQNSYNVISEINKLVSYINNAAGADDNMYLSSGAYEGAEIITFDYICEGMPVKLTENEMENAVYCVVSNGNILEYKHILRDYEKTGEYITTPGYITAVDNTIQKYSSVTGAITISKLYLAYNDTGTQKELSAGWNTDVEDIILGNEEE